MNTQLQRSIIARVQELSRKAEILGYAVPTKLNINFDLRGGVAGWAKHSTAQGYWISFNMEIARNHPHEFLHDTVPHEFAHIVQFCHFHNTLKRGTKPHGIEWKTIMRRLGYTPQRLHSFDYTPARKVERKFSYACACKAWMFTAVRHNRNMRYLATNNKPFYRCNCCGKTLQYLGDSDCDCKNNA